ncbi:MAG: methionine synthase [Chloroflexi bacterium]|nr:methionine synthase [Chloroflexota bacterium]
MFDRNERIQNLKKMLQARIVILDGATGTAIQELNLNAEDFGGEEYEGCNEHLCITKPESIANIHHSYFNAGADITETNSFGSTPLVLQEYGLEDIAWELNYNAAKIARDVANSFEINNQMKFVAGSMGPTTKTLSVTGGVSFEELVKSYEIQSQGLIEGGVDFLLIETSQDPLNLKSALIGIDQTFENIGFSIPIAIQATIESMGTTLAGQDIESFYETIKHRDLLWVGINCATGPEFMTDHIKTLSEISKFPVSCVPNAGLPDENGLYSESPQRMSSFLQRFLKERWINVVGGCCGTTPAHIKEIASQASIQTPRNIILDTDTKISGLTTVTVNKDTSPVLIGERLNVLGSRKFKRLISEGKIEEAAEIGRDQIEWGAQVLDICLQDPDRNEMEDIKNFLRQVTKKVRSPIMIDTTDKKVMEEALKLTPGKSILNSINLEDGLKRFEEIVPLAKQYGAALVVGCIDDDPIQAQAITRERKLEVAQKSYLILTETFGIAPEDIIFDPLVFPIGTGDESYIGSGVETIEGIKLIKKEFPLCKTVLGISNVSFGLPLNGREVLNAVFLYHCVQAGLDMAIVNPERLERYISISDEDKQVSENLIYWTGNDPIGDFASNFRGKEASKPKANITLLPLEERLANYIIRGSKQGLIEDLEKALEISTPLEIINGPLMAGMDEVGQLFNDNQMIVAEVLQSAESMKAAVSFLEQFMDKSDTIAKGKIMLATVKGDVHDIGKNLVDIILSNNGYTVINLGIKIPPGELIQAYNKHKPDIIGLSGLLVKSAQMMVETAQEFKESNITVPILVGGAALTNRFTRLRIAPEYNGLVAYAQDAMQGLGITNRLLNEKEVQLLTKELANLDIEMQDSTPKDIPYIRPVEIPSTIVNTNLDIPEPQSLTPKIYTNYDLKEIFSYINPVMLYTRHLGYRGRFEEALMTNDPKAMELYDLVKEVQNEMIDRKDIIASAIYKFFPAFSEQKTLIIYDDERILPIEKFEFGRQSTGDLLCLSDFVSSTKSGKPDHIAMFVTSISDSARLWADKLRSDGEFLRSHIVQSLAIEGAEAFAEIIHQQIRNEWGIKDKKDITLRELFQARYTGKRYSFGYPACPRLEDQEKLFRLLNIQSLLPVSLTEGYMMEPESSVSALVTHHVDAKYFNLNVKDIEILEKDIENNQ